MHLLLHTTLACQLEETIAGVGHLAEARVLDVISWAPDQNAQESFPPGEMDTAQDGAGREFHCREERLCRSLPELPGRGNFPPRWAGPGTLIRWGDDRPDDQERLGGCAVILV